MTKTLRTCAKDQHQMVQVLLYLDWLLPNSYKNLKTKTLMFWISKWGISNLFKKIKKSYINPNFNFILLPCLIVFFKHLEIEALFFEVLDLVTTQKNKNSYIHVNFDYYVTNFKRCYFLQTLWLEQLMISQDHHIHFQRLKESAKSLEIHQSPLHPKQEHQDNPLEEMLRYF